MGNADLPCLDEVQIRRLTTPGSYERGEDYYSRQAILEPLCQGSILSAYCVGTSVYQATVILGEDSIVRHSCSCLYNQGGLCKHRVALLLTWLRQPAMFRKLPSLREKLEAKSKAELIDLIEIMVEREPILLSFVGVVPGFSRSLIKAAFQLPRSYAIVEALQPLVEDAQVLLKAGNRLNAGWLYQLLLSELTQSYTAERQALDYNGELCQFSMQLVEGIRECLEDKMLSETVQNAWIDTLLEAYCKDLEAGGIDYADGVDFVLLATEPFQWERIVKMLRGWKGSAWVKHKIQQLIEKRNKSQQSLKSEQDFDAVLKRLQEKVERYINQRNRRSYRKSIEFLQQIKLICDRTQQQSLWECYLESLRSRYSPLKSLWLEIEASDLYE